MAGESIIDKVKAKVAKLKSGHHDSAAPGTAGVHMPGVAARHTGTSLNDKPSKMQRIKIWLFGGSSSATGPRDAVANSVPTSA